MGQRDCGQRCVSTDHCKDNHEIAEKATALFQYALRTRADCECLSHVLQTLTDLDSTATILSLDGVGGFDLVSRNAMLKGLLTMEGGDQVLPFVWLFYGDPSTFLWDNDLGRVHSVLQGEGGEQGDPLMPMLFSLGQHAALMAVAAARGGTARSWTICTSSPVQTGQWKCTTFCVKSCGATQESVCTKGKHAFGTVAGSCQTGATFSSKLQELFIPQRKCGEAATRTELNLGGLLSSAPQWGAGSLSNRSC